MYVYIYIHIHDIYSMKICLCVCVYVYDRCIGIRYTRIVSLCLTIISYDHIHIS